MKMCSCSLPSSSSSTTINVNFFFWKSSFIILGQKNRPIFWLPSYTRIPANGKIIMWAQDHNIEADMIQMIQWECVWLPVGVSPNEYCEPSLPRTVWVSTPYISRSLASDKYSFSASDGVLPLKIKSWTTTNGIQTLCNSYLMCL